ncbi:MAG: WHG domain-containing protein [Aeromicrobium sp.]
MTTARVIATGADLADEVGFAGVTVSEIARRLGVRTASLYSHVHGSADVQTGITLLALEELADRCATAIAGRAGRDALVAFGDVYRSYATEHPGRYDAARGPLEPDVAAGSAGPRHSAMMRAMLLGYGLAPTEQTHAIRMIGSFFHGFIALERSGSFSHSSPEPQVSWDHILDTLDAVLRGMGDTTTTEAPA